MRAGLVLLALLALAACGVEGAPEKQRDTGVSISGMATIGVSGRY